MATSKGNKESKVGSRLWANRLRSDARKISKALDTGYMDLAKILYTVWDTPVDGDKKNPPVFTLWGYDTFGKYAEGDLGIEQKQAERMRKIWGVLNVQMDIPADLRKKIIALGISKVRELVRLFGTDKNLTKRKVEAWVKAGEKHSYTVLVGMISKAIDELKLLSDDNTADDDEGGDDDGDVSDVKVTDDDDDGYGPPQGRPGEGRPKGNAPVATSSDPGLPDPEPLEFQHFPLYPEQNETVKAALKRAEELSGSDKRGHNLTLICTDFISTNDFFQGKPNKTKQRMLQKLEKTLGIRLVALDESDQSVLYGQKLLKEISEEE